MVRAWIPSPKAAQLVPLVVGVLLLLGCSSVKKTVFIEPAIETTAIRRVAVMPLITSGATRVDIEGTTWSPGWIVERRSQSALAPAAHQMAQSAMLAGLRESWTRTSLVEPKEVDTAMAGTEVATFELAIAEVASRTGSEAVLSMRFSDVVLRPQSQVEGRATATGRSELTLFSPEGEILWSITSQNVYAEGGINHPAPAMHTFVGYVLKKYQPEIEKLQSKMTP